MQILGYACINTQLSKNGIMTNRRMIRSTFEKRGIDYCAELAYKNVLDLMTVVTWNYNNKVSNYRMSSDLFPWMSEYEITDLPNFESVIKPLLEEIGEAVKIWNQKLSFHPGQFNCLASPNEDIVKRTVHELEQHNQIMDIMGLPATPLYNINIHVGGVYGNKQETIKRFIKNFKLLSPNLQNRLTVENDDLRNGYRVEDLVIINHGTGIPIVFDTLHYHCNPGKFRYDDAFSLAYSTWKNVIPEIHHSSSRTIEEPTARKSAHADYIYEKAKTLGKTVYITIESKMKELAMQQYLTAFTGA